jgi:hypothetical protein
VTQQTQPQTKPLSDRFAAAIAGLKLGEIAVVQCSWSEAVLKGRYLSFDAAEAQAAQLATPRRTYLAHRNNDGTVTIYRGDREHPSKTRWTAAMDLPPVDEADKAYLNALRIEAVEIGHKLAHAEKGCAARVLFSLFGSYAVRLLVAKDETDSGDTTIVPLVLLDKDNKPLWFNADDDLYGSGDYPGTEDIKTSTGQPVRSVTRQVTETLAAHLEAAYDAVGGCGHALDADTDDHFGAVVNLLVFDIPDALLPFYMTEPIWRSGPS